MFINRTEFRLYDNKPFSPRILVITIALLIFRSSSIDMTDIDIKAVQQTIDISGAAAPVYCFKRWGFRLEVSRNPSRRLALNGCQNTFFTVHRIPKSKLGEQ
jgi:hypothetical protein